MISIPTTGDVVVHEVHSTASAPYGLGTYGGPIQFTASSNKRAHDQADKFARHHGLDVWKTSDDQHYARTAQFRQT